MRKKKKKITSSTSGSICSLVYRRKEGFRSFKLSIALLPCVAAITTSGSIPNSFATDVQAASTAAYQKENRINQTSAWSEKEYQFQKEQEGKGERESESKEPTD